MKTLPLLLIGLLSVLLIMSGCSNNTYVELTKETFQDLDASKVISVSVASIPHGTEHEPDKWEMKYTNVFPIEDPEKIKTIYICIVNGDTFDYDADRKILFTTEDVIYHIGFGWTDEAAYGDWWKSPELMEKFKQWGIQHPRGEKYPPPDSITKPPWSAPEKGEGMLK